MKAYVCLGILVLSMLVVSASDSSELVDDVINRLNNNESYVDFLSGLRYDSVKLAVGNETYYIVCEDSVKLVNETETDVSVEFSDSEFEEFASAYDDQDVGLLGEIVFDKVPFRVKFNMFFQCMKTPWCRDLVF